MAPQREWLEKDYYAVLGVPTTATPKEITKAYRKLARELHPDKNPNNAAAEERFKEASAAYDVLGDDTRRAEYDEVRRLGPVGGMGGATGPVGWATCSARCSAAVVRVPDRAASDRGAARTSAPS